MQEYERKKSRKIMNQINKLTVIVSRGLISWRILIFYLVYFWMDWILLQ